MQAKSRSWVVALIASSLFAVSAHAHHAVQSEFDVNKFVYLKGVLKKVEWLNPHSYMQFMVMGADGVAHEWNIETAAPNALRRAGIATRDAFKVGESYALQIHPARDGSNTGLMNEVTLPDGKKVQVGSQQSVNGAAPQ